MIGDQRLRALHISGVFRVGNTKEFVHSLSEYFLLRIETDTSGDYLLLEAPRAYGQRPQDELAEAA